ncbi:MAG: S-layer y domain protein [Holophagaceae bacterium]|nr:S-layer y domain protein [Holophagaceae bacterium]
MKSTLALLGLVSCAPALFAAAPDEPTGLKLTGFLNYRYEYTENPRLALEDSNRNAPSAYGNASIDSKSETRLNLFVFLDNQFDGHTRFHAALGGEHLGGRTTRTGLDVKEAYLAAKFGPAEFSLGRFLPTDVPMGSAPYMDGIRAFVGNDKVTAVAYVTKFGNAYSTSVYNQATYDALVEANPNLLVLQQVGKMFYSNTNDANFHCTFVTTSLKAKPLPGLTLGVSYFADVTSEEDIRIYKTTTFSAEYKYITNNVPWFALSGEYGRNTAGGAEGLNTNISNPASATSTSPTAYEAKLKILGAHPFMPGTGGCHIQYRKAESGYDIMGMASVENWGVPFNWSSPSGGGMAENHKGIEVGAEVTVLPRTILKAAYGFMKSDSTETVAARLIHPVGGKISFGAPSTDKENYFTASVFYLF